MVILIGRTSPVSIESGPSGSGGDGQLIPGGAVGCPRPPPAGAGGCCADITEARSTTPHTPRITLDMSTSSRAVIHQRAPPCSSERVACQLPTSNFRLPRNKAAFYASLLDAPIVYRMLPV